MSNFGPYGDPRVQRWNDELDKIHAELAALKAEHTRLREAAERVLADMDAGAELGEGYTSDPEPLRAALDASPAVPLPARTHVGLDLAAPGSQRTVIHTIERETFDPSAVRVLLRWLLDMDSCDGAYTRELAQLVRDSETK